jgi:adenylate cyclase
VPRRLRREPERVRHLIDDRFSEAEVAKRVGTTPEHIRRLAQLGILECDDGYTYPRAAVLRARVVLELDRMGIDEDAVATAHASGDLTLGYVEMGGRRPPRSDLSFQEYGERIGIPYETLERLYVAFGLPRPAADELVREEDALFLKTIPILVSAGIDEGDILRLARVWGDSARKVAQFMSHYQHRSVEEPFRRQGLSDNAALEAAIREVGVRSGRSGEELLGWLYRRHSEKFEREHMFEHLETALENAGVHRKAERRPQASVFADLTGYTRLTEEAGDEVAARVSMTLADVVSAVAARHDGLVVKMLGDGVHFHFDDPHGAVMASLDVVDAVQPAGLPPAHIGVNAGPVIYDEGDYFGRTVNIAARIAAQARAGQVFVGADVVPLVEPRGFELIEVGAFELKGIADPVTVLQAVRDGSASDA